MAAEYDPSEGARKRNIIWLGIVILLGFLLPAIVPAWQEVKVVFPNVLVLGEEQVPIGVKLFCLYPGIAGVAVILLAALLRGIARSIVLLGLGALFIVLLLVLEGEGGRGAVGGPIGALVASPGAMVVIEHLAFLGLFVGSRARCFRPASLAAAIIGTVGGGLYLVSLVLPLLPPEAGSIELIRPFRALENKDTVIPALGMVTMMGCLMAASTLCIVNVRRNSYAEGLARKAFELLVVAYVSLFAAGMAEAAKRLVSQPGVRGELVLAALLETIKSLCWIVGPLLLIPVGLTDLLVNLLPPPAVPVVPVDMVAVPVAPVAAPIAAYAAPMVEAAAPFAGPAPPVAPGVPRADARTRFAELKQLLDDGLITPDEYQRKKTELLERL